jgi:hypothetical protein
LRWELPRAESARTGMTTPTDSFGHEPRPDHGQGPSSHVGQTGTGKFPSGPQPIPHHPKEDDGPSLLAGRPRPTGVHGWRKMLYNIAGGRIKSAGSAPHSTTCTRWRSSAPRGGVAKGTSLQCDPARLRDIDHRPAVQDDRQRCHRSGCGRIAGCARRSGGVGHLGLAVRARVRSAAAADRGGPERNSRWPCTC